MLLKLLRLLAVHCILLLCRRVLRPQPLLSYDAGGTPNRDLAQYYNLSSGGKSGVQPLGFQPCISARQGQYKWIGATGKVYR